jgi:hypothetical protein
MHCQEGCGIFFRSGKEVHLGKVIEWQNIASSTVFSWQLSGHTGVAAIYAVLDTLKHQLEMHRRQILNQYVKNKIQTHATRLAKLQAALVALQNA